MGLFNKSATTEEEAAPSGSAVKELLPPKVTLGDTINHKRYLDEAVIKSFEEACRGTHLLPNIAEDASWGSLKMLVMTLASLSALVAQFYPLTFPDNIWLLGVCVLIYFALSGVLQFMVTFLDRDFIYRSGVVVGGEGGVAVLRSTLPKGTQTYTVIAEYPKGREVGRLESSVGAYYRRTGFLVPENVERDVRAVLCGPWRAAQAVQVVGELPSPLPPGALGTQGFSAWAEFYKPRFEAVAGCVVGKVGGLGDAHTPPASVAKVYAGWRGVVDAAAAAAEGGPGGGGLKDRDYGKCFREELGRIMGAGASERLLGAQGKWEELARRFDVGAVNGRKGEDLVRLERLVEEAKKSDPRLKEATAPTTTTPAASQESKKSL